MTDVSVLMSVYREPIELVRESIESTLKSVQELSYEFIVVVDNPMLSSEVREYLESLSGKLTLIWNNDNLGLARSLNKAIDIAVGRYSMRMDADDICCEGRAKKQCEYMDDNPNVALLGGGIEKLDVNGDSKGLVFSVEKIPALRRRHPLFYSTQCFHPTWFIRTEILKEFRYRELSVAQDLEFLFRLLMSGRTVANLNSICVKYRILESSVSSKKAWLQINTRRALNYLYRQGVPVSSKDIFNKIEEFCGSKDKEPFEKYNDCFIEALLLGKYYQLIKILILSPLHRYRFKLIIYAKLIRLKSRYVRKSFSM